MATVESLLEMKKLLEQKMNNMEEQFTTVINELKETIRVDKEKLVEMQEKLDEGPGGNGDEKHDELKSKIKNLEEMIYDWKNKDETKEK